MLTHKNSKINDSADLNSFGIILQKQDNQNQAEEDEMQKKISQFQKLIPNIKLKFLAKQWKNATRSHMYKNISLTQLKQIDDKSWSPNQESKKRSNWLSKAFGKLNLISGTLQSNQINKNRSQINRILALLYSSLIVQQFLRYLDRKIPVMEPTSLQKKIWDYANIFLILIYTIQIPMFISFNENRDFELHWILFISVPFFLFIDILFSINTGCYDKGCFIKKRINLLEINMPKVILPDMLVGSSYIAFMVIDKYLRIQSNSVVISRWQEILLLSLFWKIQEFSTIVNKLQDHTMLSKKSRNIIGLIKLILTILYIGHILACIWVIIAKIEDNFGIKTWAKFDSIQETNWHSLYLDAYYFTTVTMITVGYGDFLPVNEIEKLICIIIMIFSCGVFAYSMNTIGAILESFNEDQVKKNLSMQIINTYMTRKNVSKPMKNQIREYLDYYWKEESERDQSAEENIINQLSDSLKKGLLLESKNVVLKKQAIFRKNFSDTLKEKIVPLIREYRCSPQEFICSEGEIDDCSIYFIEKGSVEIFFQTSESKQGIYKSIASLQNGESFGERSFFTGKCRTASIRSKEFTTLLSIKRSEFLQVLVNHQDDYEKFCTIRDRIDFYDNYSAIGISCLSCDSKNHQIVNCPYSHFIGRQSYLKDIYSFRIEQSRTQFLRQNKKSSSIINQVIVQSICEEYSNQNDDSIRYFVEECGIGQVIEDEEEKSQKSNSSSNEDHIIQEEEEEESQQDFQSELPEEYDNKHSGKNTDQNHQNSSTIESQIDSQKRRESSEKHKTISPNKMDQQKVKLKMKQANTQIWNKTDTLPSQVEIYKSGKLKPNNQKSDLIKAINTIQIVKLLEKGNKNPIFTKNSNDENKKLQDKELSVLNSAVSKIQIAKYLQNGKVNQKIEDNQSLKNSSSSQKKLSKQNLSQNKKKGTFFDHQKQSKISLRLDDRKQTMNYNMKRTRDSEAAISIIPSSSRISIPDFRLTGQALEKLLESNEVDIEVKEVLEKMYEEQQHNNQIENDFDLMQNFTYYFPLNNFSYQEQLFLLPDKEKRRVMIWNTYDCISQTIEQSQSFQSRKKRKTPGTNPKKQNRNERTFIDSKKSKLNPNLTWSKRQTQHSNSTIIQRNLGSTLKLESTYIRNLQTSENQQCTQEGDQKRLSQRYCFTNQENKRGKYLTSRQNLNNPILQYNNSLTQETQGTILNPNEDQRLMYKIKTNFPSEVSQNTEKALDTNIQACQDKMDSYVLNQDNSFTNCITFENNSPQICMNSEFFTGVDFRQKKQEYQFQENSFSENSISFDQQAIHQQVLDSEIDTKKQLNNISSQQNIKSLSFMK